MKKKKLIAGVFIAVLIVVIGFLIYNKQNGIVTVPPYSSINITPPENMEEIYKEDFEKATEDLRKDENNYEALLVVARIRAWSGDYDGAIKIYEKMSTIKEGDILPYFNRGEIYHSIKNYDKAGEMYEKVIEINPKWVNAYREIFSLYRFELTHKYDENIEAILISGLEKSKDLGGEGYSDYYAMLGIYHKDKRETEKAIENFEKVIELDPTNVGAKSELEELKN